MSRVQTLSLRRGYTLIELLVSIVIFGILLGLVLANFHRGGLTNDLRQSAQELTGNIRRMQNLSTVGQTLNIGGTPTVPPGGYGLFIEWVLNADNYLLYADVYNEYGGGGCDPSNANNADSQYNPACDPLVEAKDVALKPHVIINRIAIGDVIFPPGAGGDVNIGFKPPKPIPLVNGAAGDTVQIELMHAETSDYRTITIIGASGQVSERLGQLNI